MTPPAWLVAALPIYGLSALFVAMVLEGPLATVLGAFFAAQGFAGLAQIYLLALAADLTGDSLYYLLGRMGRVPHCLWRGRKGLRRRKRALWLQAHLHRHAGRLLLTGKLTHALGFMVLIAAGAARVPFLAFLGWNLLAAVPKTALFTLVGYFGGAAYQHFDFYLWLFSAIALCGLAAASCAWVRFRILPFLPED